LELSGTLDDAHKAAIVEFLEHYPKWNKCAL
jgi:hypothetical protein